MANDIFAQKLESRYGIYIEKGVELTSSFLDENEEVIKQWLNHWMMYPDLFLDDIAPVNSPIKLFFYQRIALRAGMRYRYHSWTATRATSKSFVALLTLFLKAIFLPGSKLFTCSDVKGTAIKITKQKLDEILAWWPLLRKEIKSQKMSTDYIELEFNNGSIFSIVSMTSAGRGTRATAGIIEESALINNCAYAA